MSQKRQGGPPPRGVMMPGAAKGAGKSFVRLLSYMKKYWLQLVLVLVCILVSAIAGVAGSTFLQTLIDDYISPMLLDGSRDFSGLARALTRLGVLYAAGILGTLFYNRLMVVVAQGILKTIRDEMFSHMQTLPVRFFDTHASGDIMSLYTNDTDTLRADAGAECAADLFVHRDGDCRIRGNGASEHLADAVCPGVCGSDDGDYQVRGRQERCVLRQAAELHRCGERLY